MMQMAQLDGSGQLHRDHASIVKVFLLVCFAIADIGRQAHGRVQVGAKPWPRPATITVSGIKAGPRPVVRAWAPWLITPATTAGRETNTAWLPGVSVTVPLARSDMARWAAGGIMWSSVATRYQDGLLRQAGSVTAPFSASTAVGTWESAMNAASFPGTSAAKDAANLSRSRNRNPLTGGRIGGTGAPGGGSAISELTDSPVSGANAAREASAGRLGWLPASAMTTPPEE